MTNDGRNSERVAAFKRRRYNEARQSANPNNGKRGAARLEQRENLSGVKASPVAVKYMPGKTVDARIAGMIRQQAIIMERRNLA